MTPLSGPVLTAAEMREAEAGCGVPPGELMDRAGRALAEAAWRFGNGAPTLVLCGPGNNGGDGYVAARLLAERGLSVRVAVSGAPASDPAKATAARWTGPVEPLAEARAAPVLIDALFGTGLTRPLASEIREPLHRLANAARFVIAADLPSGVATDSGADLGASHANLTLAFAAAKPAHLLQPAADRCGQVRIADIGIVARSVTDILGAPSLPAPTAADHKYTRGYVLIVGGAMAGAGALAATAAARAGAGYVVLAGEGGSVPNAVIRRSRDPIQRLLGDKRTGAALIGPGLGEDERTLAAVLASDHPLVLDGDALQPGLPKRVRPTILTPHAGEFTRMFGAGEGSKLDRARAAAAQSGATIIFKGADTVIASPDDRATLAPPASPWLSTAGTGDVLAGIAVTMLARGLAPHDAACAAVWLHGEAARRAGPGLIADDLPGHIRLA